MKTVKQSITLADCEVIKLKEYSMSYGGAEAIRVPFIRDYGNEIMLMNEEGKPIRIMRTGTKLLVSYSGNEITERAFKQRTNKAAKIKEANRLIQQERERAIKEEMEKKLAEQEAILKSTFEADKEFLAKIQDRINNHSGKNWRGWIKMKVCAKVFGGKYENMILPSTSIRDIAFSIN